LQFQTVLLKSLQNELFTQNFYSILLKNEIFGLFQVVRRHCAGEVGKFTTTSSRQIFTGCCVPKIIKIAKFLTELFPKQKGGRFFETQCMCSHFSWDLRESQDRVQGRLGELPPFALPSIPVATLPMRQ